MRTGKQQFIPALRFHFLTGLYDPVLRWTMREREFKGKMLLEIQAGPGHRILDIGCGTGTLTMMLKRAFPDSTIIGVDIDPKVLALAKRKTAKARLVVEYHEASATSLPFADGYFDSAVTSLMVHHLQRNDKQAFLAEVFRILKPGGILYLTDFGMPRTALTRATSVIVQYLEKASDNMKGLIPDMMHDAGFTSIREYGSYETLFGTVSLLKGFKPLSPT